MKINDIFHGHLIAMSHIHHAINLYSSMPVTKRDVLIKWKNRIKNMTDTPDMPYDFLLSMTIGLPTGIFSYQFDSTSLLSYLQREKIQSISLNPHMLFLHSKMQTHALDFPIVVLETPLLSRGYVLSGHRQIAKAKEKGKQVNIFVLTEMEYLSLMYDDISKAMYMFHRDVQNLLSTPHPLPSHALFLSQADLVLKN